MSNDVASAFGQLLAEKRAEAGLTQEDLGFRTGLDRSSISKLEQGINTPKLTTIILLAGALNIEPADLIPPIRWKPSPISPAPAGQFTRQ